MKQLGHSAIPLIKLSIKKEQKFHAAALLSPLEVELAINVDAVELHEQVIGHWVLSGVVSNKMFAKLRADGGKDTFAGLEILCTPAGTAYAIYCSQLGPFQHRHVLALHERKVVELLASAARKPFKMILQKRGFRGERMVYESPYAPSKFNWALSVSDTIDFARSADFFKELPDLVKHASTLNMIPSLNGDSVMEVDVSILLPREVNFARTKATTSQ